MDDFDTETIKKIWPHKLPYHYEIRVDRDVGEMVEVRYIDENVDGCDSSIAIDVGAVEDVCWAMKTIAEEIKEHQEE